MTELIYCQSCGTIQKNIFSAQFRYGNYTEFNTFNSDAKKLMEYLEKKRQVIIWNWSDLEQTEEEYMKFCPICNKGTYYKKVEITLDINAKVE